MVLPFIFSLMSYEAPVGICSLNTLECCIPFLCALLSFLSGFFAALCLPETFLMVDAGMDRPKEGRKKTLLSALM